MGTLELFVMNADGTNQRQLTNDTYPQYVTSQAWSTRTLETGSDVFDDVPKGHDADRPIGWTSNNGVTSGVGERRFDPNGTVTRAQIVTFLYRIANLLEDK